MITGYNDLTIKDFKDLLDGKNPLEIIVGKPLNDILITEIDNISTE